MTERLTSIQITAMENAVISGPRLTRAEMFNLFYTLRLTEEDNEKFRQYFRLGLESMLEAGKQDVEKVLAEFEEKWKGMAQKIVDLEAENERLDKLYSRTMLNVNELERDLTEARRYKVALEKLERTVRLVDLQIVEDGGFLIVMRDKDWEREYSPSLLAAIELIDKKEVEG